MLDRCALCDVAARGLCRACRFGLPEAVQPDLRPTLESVHVVFGYTDTGVDLLRLLKFSNRRSSLAVLVDALVDTITATRQVVDAVVSVPPNSERMRRRGYDLPELMARRFSRTLGVPQVRSLLRLDTGDQRLRSRSERRESLRYAAIEPTSGRVLLVDDVVTTGATLANCADALRYAGATSVIGAVLAATPELNAGVRVQAADTVQV